MDRSAAEEREGQNEAALVVLVPETEPFVGPIRREHDPSAADGVPAHITVNYPFSPKDADEDVLYARLRRLFRSVDAFEFSLVRTGRFSDVLYLVPEPEAPFQELIQLIAQQFPESPPYGGAFTQIVPHLTVADSEDQDLLAALESQLNQALRAQLPIRSRAERIWLIDNQAGPWHHRASFPLGTD